MSDPTAWHTHYGELLMHDLLPLLRTYPCSPRLWHALQAIECQPPSTLAEWVHIAQQHNWSAAHPRYIPNFGHRSLTEMLHYLQEICARFGTETYLWLEAGPPDEPRG